MVVDISRKSQPRGHPIETCQGYTDCQNLTPQLRHIPNFLNRKLNIVIHLGTFSKRYVLLLFLFLKIPTQMSPPSQPADVLTVANNNVHGSAL